MDARPFRPARPLAVPGNENMAPAKQIHHKHKSTGNLLQQQHQPVNGSLQVAAKRAAFGDRSNTARNTLSRDDSSISTKPKSAAAMVPPSKPVAPAKGQENPDSIRAVGKDAAKKETAVVPVVRRNSHLNLPPKKATHLPSQPKRTTVYADPPRPDDAIEDVASSLESLRGLVIPSSPEPAAVPTPEDEKSHPCNEKSQSNLPLGITHSDDDAVAEPPYLDAVEELPAEVINYPVLDAKPLSLIPLSYLPDPEPAAKVSAKTVDFTALDLLSHSPDEDPAYISEPDEDLYDDQGYTTAHSVRDQDEPTAHHDHTDPTRTSSNATLTVMFPPKLGKKGLAELEAAKGFVEAKRAYEDFDEDLWDISMVAEYGTEIFEYMRKMELLPKSHYMDIQTEIQWSMRAVLMDWVIQVHGRFGLLPETLFLTANYIDRFLSVKVVSLGKLQLVGATALFIAAKYEEINCPSVQEIVYMVDGGYTIDEILKAERFMLTMLEFNLGWPGPMSFLRRISKADDYDLETRTLSKYFLEVALMDERFVASPPSYVAAGSHCLSRLILEKGDWTTEHVYYSSYTFDQLKPIVGLMLDCCRTAARHHAAVFEKYSDKRYKRAASYVQTELKNGFELSFQAPVRQAWQPCPPEDEKFNPLHFASPTEYQQYKMPIPMQG